MRAPVVCTQRLSLVRARFVLGCLRSFRSIARELADFYCLQPAPSGGSDEWLPDNDDDIDELQDNHNSSNNAGNSAEQASDTGSAAADGRSLSAHERHVLRNEQAKRREVMQHVLFPALKRHLKPPTRMVTDGCYVNVAALESLYKVFERC